MRIPLVRITKFDDDNIKELNEWILRVTACLSQNIEFGDGTSGGSDNLYCDFATVQFGTAGAELTASHDLERTPIGVIVIKADRPGDVYFSSAATSANAFLKSDSDNLSGIIIIL